MISVSSMTIIRGHGTSITHAHNSSDGHRAIFGFFKGKSVNTLNTRKKKVRKPIYGKSSEKTGKIQRITAFQLIVTRMLSPSGSKYFIACWTRVSNHLLDTLRYHTENTYVHTTVMIVFRCVCMSAAVSASRVFFDAVVNKLCIRKFHRTHNYAKYLK